MKKDDLMTLLVLGAGGFALYYYVTRYGPQGAVYNAAGAKIGPSYWDSWFGGATPAITTQPATQATGGTSTTPPVITAPPVAQKLTAANAAQVVASLNSLATGNTQMPGLMGNSDQWTYYLKMVPYLLPPADDQLATVYPSTSPVMSAAQYVQTLVNANLSGLGDLVRVSQTMASNWGGSATGGAGFRGAFRPTFGKSWVQ